MVMNEPIVIGATLVQRYSVFDWVAKAIMKRLLVAQATSNQ